MNANQMKSGEILRVERAYRDIPIERTASTKGAGEIRSAHRHTIVVNGKYLGR